MGWNTLPVFGLPKTGQTATSPTANYAVGDDGYYQVGDPFATRHVDNGDGTIRDVVTGLAWVKQPELMIPGTNGDVLRGGSPITSNQVQDNPDKGDGVGVWKSGAAYDGGDLVTNDGLFYACILAVTSATTPVNDPTHWRPTVWTASAANLTTPSTMTWGDAIAYCEDLGYAGYDDWRMPNFIEAVSLLEPEGSAPYINSIFPNIQSGAVNYWTSTTNALTTANALYVRYGQSFCFHTAKTGTAYVLPVRGGFTNA